MKLDFLIVLYYLWLHGRGINNVNKHYIIVQTGLLMDCGSVNVPFSSMSLFSAQLFAVEKYLFFRHFSIELLYSSARKQEQNLVRAVGLLNGLMVLNLN